MALSVGDFFVRIGADLGDFKTKMREFSDELKVAEDNIDQLSKRLAQGAVAMGTAVTAFVALSAKGFARTGSELNMLSKRTGVSVEFLSRLSYVAAQSNTSLSSFEVGMRRLQGTLTDAQGGMESYQKAFATLGLDYEQLAILSPEEQFRRVLYALGGVTDATVRASLAVDLLGRSGTDMLPIVSDGAAAFEAAMQAADDLGVTMDESAVAAAQELSNAMTDVHAAVGGLTRAIAEGIAPLLTELADDIAGVVSAFSGWIDRNPVLATTITQVVGGIGALLVALGAVVLIGPKVVAAASAIGAALHLSLGPLGLVALAIGGLVTALLYFQNAARQATEDARRLAMEGLALLVTQSEEALAAAHALHAEQSKALARVAAEYEAYLAREEEAARLSYDERIAYLRAYYGTIAGEAELFQKTLVTLTRQEYQARIDALDKEYLAFHRLWMFKLQKNREAYSERMSQIQQELRAQLAAYQQQLNELDRVESQETRARLEARREQIYAALEVVQTEKARLELLAELAEVERSLVQQTRAEQRQAIQDQMDQARELAETRQDEATDTYTHELNIIDQTVREWIEGSDAVRQAIIRAWEADTKGMVDYYDLFADAQEKERLALETALQTRLEQIARERIENEKLEEDKLKATLQRLNAEREAQKDRIAEMEAEYKRMLDMAIRYHAQVMELDRLAKNVLQSDDPSAWAAYQTFIRSLDVESQRRMQPYIEAQIHQFEDYWAAAAQPTWMDKLWSNLTQNVSDATSFAKSVGGFLGRIVGMQHGGRGVVREPTLFLAGEAGPEAFAFGDQAAPQLAAASIPLVADGGGMVVNFNGAIFAGTREDAERFANLLMPALRRRQIGNMGRADW